MGHIVGISVCLWHSLRGRVLYTCVRKHCSANARADAVVGSAHSFSARPFQLIKIAWENHEYCQVALCKELCPGIAVAPASITFL